MRPCPAPALDPILYPEPPVTAPLSLELTLMIQERGNENVAMGQTHARMMLKWSEAAGEGDSGNSWELEGALVGEGRRS